MSTLGLAAGLRQKLKTNTRGPGSLVLKGVWCSEEKLMPGNDSKTMKYQECAPDRLWSLEQREEPLQVWTCWEMFCRSSKDLKFLGRSRRGGKAWLKSQAVLERLGKGGRYNSTNNEKTKLTSRESLSAVGPVLEAQGGPALCPVRNWGSILQERFT